ncbi:TetR/AcrR family transcriptional regulator [Lentzea sp. CA-135723]|uniref:TetR/AcrR family transcriptional regulator n=1 Tax=Lentzea sp. CA-135723 TaxID=3239950 RepID=UPI003D89F313
MNVRADAVRNRGLLIEVARDAFTHQKDATLGAIAKQAGVGIGTLYRHFPTREALIEAVYRAELEKLCDAAPELLEAHAPEVALREWMNHFIGYINAKHDLKDALQAVFALGVNPFEHSRAKLIEAITLLLTPLRATAAPLDVMTLVVAVSQNDDEDQAGRLLDLIMAGILHGAETRPAELRSAPPAPAPR